MEDPRPIRILHLVDSFDQGGAQAVIENLVKYGDRRQFEWAAYSLHGPGSFEPRLRALGIETGHLGIRRINPLLPLRLLALVRRFKPDVIHSHLVASDALCELLRWAMPRSVRLLSHLHNLLAHHEENRYQDWLESRLYRRCDCAVACGHTVGDSFRGHFEGRPVPLVAIQNGVDDARLTGRDLEMRFRMRRKLGLAENQCMLFTASRIMDQKNLSYAVQVMKRLHEHLPGARLFIAGEGPGVKELENRITSEQAASCVSLMGYRDDVPDLLSAADIYLVTSHHEGLSLSLVEAMGKELLPVVTPFKGAEEVIHSRQNGLIIPFEQAEEAATGIFSIWEDTALRQVLAQAAFRDARERFPASRMAREMEMLYRAMVEGGDVRTVGSWQSDT